MRSIVGKNTNIIVVDDWWSSQVPSQKNCQSAEGPLGSAVAMPFWPDPGFR